MSPSPKDLADRPAVDAYAAAWKAIMKSARSGNSWSGSEANRTFLNTGGARFADTSYISGLGFKDDGRALAVTDWDGDGDLDLWTHNRTAPRLRLMRNNSTSENHSVSFQLTAGQKSNRDAVGTRLTLRLPDGSTLAQTRRAGSGFLSQSSSWIHFGLGAGADPASLHVRWPDGSEESFTAIAKGTRYHIEQGGTPQPVAARNISPLTFDPTIPTTRSAPPRQTIFPGKIPLPQFSFTPTGSQKPTTLSTGDNPLLIVLFSGSCQSCAAELAELTSAEIRLRDSRLDVLALSVDGLATGTDPDTASRLLTSTRFPFPTGTIAPSTADHLRFLLDSLYDFPAPFSVPLSLLLDRERRLFAVYRGQTSPQRILHDAGFSTATPDQLRDLAVPFPGRWFTDSITPQALAELVANPFLEAFPLQGLLYLEHALASASSPDQKLRLQRQLSSSYHFLARQEKSAGRQTNAITYFEKTLTHNPNNFEARIDYGALLGNQGNLDAAETQFRQALELDPANPVATKNLDLLLRR